MGLLIPAFVGRMLILTLAMACPASVLAFESDVHFGLTKWLALEAGFDPLLVDFIATGNHRMDAGMMDSLEPVLEYACLASDADAAKRMQRLHYPGRGPIPGPPESRAVTAGGEAAMEAAEKLIVLAEDKGGFLLHKLGEALHAVQDSWAHQGVPEVPAPGGIGCSPELAWGHPEARGGSNSHRADLTMHWPADVERMAAVTYDLLKRYPPIRGAARSPEAWADLRPQLEAFIDAPTKAAKSDWFRARGIQDTSFLEGVSLPDGDEPWEGRWKGRWLPPLTAPGSRQWDAPEDVKAFFDGMFEAWLSGADVARLLGPASAEAAGSGAPDAAGHPDQLAARLALWRIRDHGAVAELAHSQAPLSAAQMAKVNALAGDQTRHVRYDDVADAFFPLLAKGPHVSPLLPYVTHLLDTGEDGRPRAAAVAKLRHAPYDVLAFIAEQFDGTWRLISVLSVVDH